MAMREGTRENEIKKVLIFVSFCLPPTTRKRKFLLLGWRTLGEENKELSFDLLSLIVPIRCQGGRWTYIQVWNSGEKSGLELGQEPSTYRRHLKHRPG